jgi:hypothetical protein
LFHDFEAAVLDQRTDGEPNDLASKNATEVFKAYETASSGLRQNIHVFARKAELYLDWPSDLNRDRITPLKANSDPLNSTSALGARNFDCDKETPKFEDGQPSYPPRVTSNEVNWNRAKHHVLTIGYCFYVTHVGYMGVIREWASRGSFSPNDRIKFFENSRNQSCKNQRAVLQARLNTEVVRLNAFMSLAMVEIERIRTRYRQDDFLCSLPGVSEIRSKKCKPI